MLLYLSPLDIYWMKKTLGCLTEHLFEMGVVKVVGSENTVVPKAIMGMREIKAGSAKFNVCHFTKAISSDKKVGRNESCVCGSGKKSKNCCGDDINKILCDCWDDRPTTCRLYPLWYVIYWSELGNNTNVVYKMTPDTFCKGCNNKGREISVEKWVDDDKKLKFGINFNKKLSEYMKMLSGFGIKGQKQMDYLANILYNFDSWMDSKLIITSDNVFSNIYFDKLDSIIRDTRSWERGELPVSTGIII